MNTKTAISPSKDFRFDAEEHKYWIGKKRVPGVSEILQKVGLTKDFKGVDPFYRDRGIATHKCIELFLKGTLDQTSIDPAVRPCLEAFRNYFASKKIGEIIALEKPMVDLSETFAGTPDLITDQAIYDWKCSKSHDKVADLQGQAYKHLALENWLELKHSPTNLGALPFIVVELHDDGTFTEYPYGTAYEEWASVMDLYRWKISKNA